jgi:hypothetical protein
MIWLCEANEGTLPKVAVRLKLNRWWLDQVRVDMTWRDKTLTEVIDLGLWEDVQA